ncbi:hypothetical protein VTK73DRAFT_7347 [Phialemonium thermophilum]|uniref:Uncharacterized protein n=1 Tax=Phialemonium thermophilum TaxID=223376 RepID=A0ABR3WF56_9PEZI
MCSFGDLDSCVEDLIIHGLSNGTASPGSEPFQTRARCCKLHCSFASDTFLCVSTPFFKISPLFLVRSRVVSYHCPLFLFPFFLVCVSVFLLLIAADLVTAEVSSTQKPLLKKKKMSWELCGNEILPNFQKRQTYSGHAVSRKVLSQPGPGGCSTPMQACGME